MKPPSFQERPTYKDSDYTIVSDAQRWYIQ